jgi:hypothetical protein
MSQDLARQQYILTHEIRLLEKRKTELQSEIDRTNVSWGEELKQHNSQIIDLTKRKQALIEQVEKLREGVSLLTTTYQKAKEDIEKYTKTKMDDLTEEIRVARELVLGLKLEAEAHMAEAEKFREAVVLREEKVITREQLADTRASALARDLAELERKKKSADEFARLAAESLQRNTEEEEKIKQSIRILTEQRVSLEHKIKVDTLSLQAREDCVHEAEAAAERQKVANRQQADILRRKEEELLEREVLLKDRQGQLERAVVEYRARGVVI